MQQKLKHILSNDLADRSKGGSILYTAIWFILAFHVGIFSTSKTFFIINTVILVLLSLLRLSVAVLIQTSKQYNAFLHRFLICLIIFSGLHWGGVTAWLINADNITKVPKQELIYILFTLEAGFAMAGASIFCISNPVRIMFPISILLAPSLILFIDQYHQANLLLALIIISLIYITFTSKKTHDDYWSSQHNKILADTRSSELEKLSITDALTSLNNRLYFDKVFQYEWERCSRDGTQLALMIIDLDFFKKINDKYGHLGGDRCLVHTANIIKNVMQRKTDTTARYGGEEFVVLMPATNREQLERKAKQLQDAIRSIKLEFEGATISLTCSIGIAITQCNTNLTRYEFFKQADDALYCAKNNGRDQYRFANG